MAICNGLHWPYSWRIVGSWGVAGMRKSGWIVGGVALAILGVADAPPVSAEDPVVNVYNWSDYIGPDVIEGFTKETGVKVNYDVYDANETLEAKLAAGHSGYDIVVPTFVPFVARGIQAGLYAEIDKSKLKNLANLDPALLAAEAKYDPGNKYSIPWIAGTVGLGVNMDKVKALLPGQAMDSLDLLLKPENAEKLKDCGITVLDSPSDVIPVILHYLGKNTDSEKPEDLQAATDTLLKIRPYIRKFDSSGYINDLANGDACLSLGYSTDVVIASVRARDAKNGVDIHFFQPKEGTLEYIDSMAIPADAPHPDQALKWIDYNLRPEVMAGTANTVNARTGVKESAPLVRPELLADPQTYPTPEIEKTLFTGPVASRAYDRQRSRAWTRVRSGS
jgi:putrescine transport system substrate-binding protein